MVNGEMGKGVTEYRPVTIATLCLFTFHPSLDR
jgi:hypothetical protein